MDIIEAQKFLNEVESWHVIECIHDSGFREIFVKNELEKFLYLEYCGPRDEDGWDFTKGFGFTLDWHSVASPSTEIIDHGYCGFDVLQKINENHVTP